MPESQPIWAQQYSFELQPIWARKFEPPAITGGESQGVIDTLMYVYRATNDRKYLKAIPKALEYLKKSELPDGRLARFYELKTNRPLYFTKTYELTYDDSDVPTHYAFKISSRIDKLQAEFERLEKSSENASANSASRASKGRIDDNQIREIVDSLDDRGACVTAGTLRYHGKPGPVIDLRVAVSNLNLLAQFLESGPSDN